MDFFEPPPQEIGPVVTAYSTLRHGPSSSRRPLRLATVCGVALLVGAGAALLLLIDQIREWQALLGVFMTATLLVGVPCGLTCLILMRFRHHVSDVGAQGVSRITIARRGRTARRQTLFFSEAAEL